MKIIILICVIFTQRYFKEAMYHTLDGTRLAAYVYCNNGLLFRQKPSNMSENG